MNQTLLENLHLEQVNRPMTYAVGDTVRVHYKITEGNKERIQIYEGTIIAIRNKGVARSIVVRRISFDVGVERIFPIYSPTIDKIEKVRSSKVRRSKLYYLRTKIGKHGRLKEVKKADRKDGFMEKAESLLAERKTAEPAAEPAAKPAEETANEEPAAVAEEATQQNDQAQQAAPEAATPEAAPSEAPAETKAETGKEEAEK